MDLKTDSYVVLTGMTLTVLDGEAFTAPLFGHDQKPPLWSIIDQYGTNPVPEARCAAPVSRDDILNDYWLDMSCDASGINGGNDQWKHVSCIIARVQQRFSVQSDGKFWIFGCLKFRKM